MSNEQDGDPVSRPESQMAAGNPCEIPKPSNSGQRKKKNKRVAPKAHTLADVDAFLSSWVARNYLAFSDSNVKRRILKMMQFLRMEVDRLQAELTHYRDQGDPKPWTDRVRK